MKCRDFEFLWLAREDGRLTPVDQTAFAQHLSVCSACARLERGMGRLEVRMETLSAAPADPPPYLSARILARIGETKPRRLPSLLQLFTTRRVLAVSTASLAFFAGLLAREAYRLNEWIRERPVQTVVLEHEAPGAGEVKVVGDFNAWGRESGPVQAERVNGRWVFRVALAPGRYQYVFLEDGKKWLPDPNASDRIPDGFGGTNSVLYVSGHETQRGRAF